MLARSRSDRWIRRAFLAVAWIALATVVLGMAVSLYRAARG
jgi:hypothetical protein